VERVRQHQHDQLIPAVPTKGSQNLVYIPSHES